MFSNPPSPALPRARRAFLRDAFLATAALSIARPLVAASDPVTAAPIPTPSPRTPSRYQYVRDGDEIRERSFAIVRRETDLTRFSPAEADVVVRMLYACGTVDFAPHLVLSPTWLTAARTALEHGAPVFCDAPMVRQGINPRYLRAHNEVICTLDAPAVPDLAKRIDNTRSAGAMELWRERLPGSVVVIGNAPTALFRLLELLDEGVAPPAAVIGVPVGFTNAPESKEALIADGRVPFLTVRGRAGGSAMAAAAVNALAHLPSALS